MRPMIDRNRVLAVARLAALQLSDEEVDRMQADLTAILDHVEQISGLDLEGVPPTMHMVPLENVWRADVPRPSLPREVALRSAPEPAEGAFRVPSPQAVD
jgi:aspartyl-tRNA(Asn)/glutamyl-tRNA(Gln) amidotransferase subunit C